MNSEHRRVKILERVERDGFASVVELAEELEVSPVTVHRDLEALAKKEVLRRVRGGARSYTLRPHEIRTEFIYREAQNRDLKRELGLFAVKFIPDRSVIFLDGSTTCASLFQALNRSSPRQLTVVTNSLAIGTTPHAPGIGIIMTPGDVDQSLRATVGSWALEFLNGINIDLAFISAAALSPESGLMTTQKSIADICRAVIGWADRTVALVDSTKFDSQALLSFASSDQIDLVLSDSFLSDDRAEEYRKAGWNLERSPRIEEEA